MSKVNFNDTIHMFKSDEYPHGYTISKNATEANELAKELAHRTNCRGVSVTHGLRHWKTGKPAYWIVYFDEPYTVKENYTLITGLI